MRPGPVTPVDWRSLPRLTRDDVALARALCLPARGEEILRDIALDLAQDLGAPANLALDGVERDEAAAPLASPGCFAVVDLPPLPGAVLVDVDLGLGLSAADRLLGGAGARPQSLRAPTAVERGALSYLALRALARLDAAWARDAGVRPRLRGVYDGAQPFCGVQVRLTFALTIGGEVGTVRIFLPRVLAESPVLRAARRPPLPGLLRGVAIEATVEIARTSLAASDLGALAPRDVLVLGRVAAGEGRLRLAGASGALRVEVADETRAWRLTVREHRVEGGTAMVEDDVRVGERALAEAQIPVTVELGRLTLAAEEIAALRPGDTLLLARPPGSPLDLAAGGKVIARGELVDVEGELGFRVLSILS
jgi:type III secretion protein Q